MLTFSLSLTKIGSPTTTQYSAICGEAGSGAGRPVVGLNERVHLGQMLDLRTLVRVMTLLVQTVRVFFKSRADLAIENLALRQQVAVLKQLRPRPPLTPLDRAFWVALQQTGSTGPMP